MAYQAVALGALAWCWWHNRRRGGSQEDVEKVKVVHACMLAWKGACCQIEPIMAQHDEACMVGGKELMRTSCVLD